jgi:hypothetical protein
VMWLSDSSSRRNCTLASFALALWSTPTPGPPHHNLHTRSTQNQE